jgi:glycosyltransferase involved in cell wall biosynthesis
MGLSTTLGRGYLASQVARLHCLGHEAWWCAPGGGTYGDLSVALDGATVGARRDVPTILAQLDAFPFAAKREEDLAIAMIEAMAAGVPVVASAVGACREVLDDGALKLLRPRPGRLVNATDRT